MRLRRKDGRRADGRQAAADAGGRAARGGAGLAEHASEQQYERNQKLTVKQILPCLVFDRILK